MCVVCERKRGVKDDSKAYSLSNWKDGVTFIWDGEDNVLNLEYLSNIEVKYMNGKLNILAQSSGGSSELDI